MPVQFTCQHCQSSLSVSSRKSGLAVTCPKCKRPTQVPAREVSSVLAADVMPAQTPAAPQPPVDAVKDTGVDDLVAQSIPPSPPPPPASDRPPLDIPAWEESADDEVSWVYEDDQPQAHVDHSHLVVDFDRVAMPRYVIFGQGILLGVVALIALMLGFLIGRGSATPVSDDTGEAKICYLTGKVQYTSSSGTKSPDDGAVVMVVPQDQRPDEKMAIEGLRPDDPLPGEEHASLVQLKAIGGDYARADAQGNFKLRVPKTGEYFLLVISRHASRKTGDRLDSVHLAQMGRYFLSAVDLLEQRRYQWRAESVKRDREFKITLE